ncbi:MAG: T9SS type A sorting domain-containing protein [Bacteroidales bacterium]|nr:T9SS type A sorting domain-containing protein [Bacteroidales bacterium]MDE7465207.1 T9SS type A sorting domain-containing protein [Muribaculaceae bacterium]
MAALKWELVRTEVVDAKSVFKESELEIKTSGNALIISSNHSVKIQVFTILGRLLISENIPAGTSRLQLPAHGVYIVKTGSITCKVAI